MQMSHGRQNKKPWLKLSLILLVGILLPSLIVAGFMPQKIQEPKPVPSPQSHEIKIPEEIIQIEPEITVKIPGAKPVKALEQDYLNPASLWFLANKEHSLPLDYVPNEIIIPAVRTQEWRGQDERSIRADIAPFVVEMFNVAQANNLSLVILSGYRSASTQGMIYNNSVAQVGEAQTRQYIAFPGQSEHQTGLAIDIATNPEECSLDWCFESTGAGEWLKNNAHRFGFILRYPKDKEALTGYNYEPWHFRFLGIDLATALYESGLTLEEAWPFLEKALVEIKNAGLI